VFSSTMCNANDMRVTQDLNSGFRGDYRSCAMFS
jgi:hypothetical protein